MAADYVNIVQDERRRRRTLFAKEPRRLLQAAAGIQQAALFGYLDPHSEVVLLAQIFSDHSGKMVHIDDDLTHSKFPQACDGDLQQRASGHLNQRLGPIIG